MKLKTLKLTRSRHQGDEDGQDGEKSVSLLILIPTLCNPYKVYRIPHNTPLNDRSHMGPHRRITALWDAREAWGVDVCGGVVRVEKKTPQKDHRHHNDSRYDGDAYNAYNSTNRRHECKGQVSPAITTMITAVAVMGKLQVNLK